MMGESPKYGKNQPEEFSAWWNHSKKGELF
jgi:hypothetical protein